MGLRNLSLILVAGAALPLAAHAEDGDKLKPKAEASATVTVTAEATPVELAKTPNPVKVIDAEAIQRSGAKTLADLLTFELPGQVSAFGGPGAGSLLKLNGSRNSDTVVLLDGIRINDATGLGLDLTRMGLEGIDRVEILQGPASTRYGADAHGGVIALYSAGSPAAGFTGTASLGLGTKGIRRGTFNPAYSWGNGWVRSGIQAMEEALPTSTPKPFRSIGGSLNLGQSWGESLLTTLTYRNHYLGSPIPYNWDYGTWPLPPARSYEPEREYSQRSEQLVGSLKWTLSPAWAGDLAVGHLTDERKEPNYGMVGQHRLLSQRTQAVANLNWSGARSGVGFTLDAQEEAGKSVGAAGISKGIGRHSALVGEAHLEPFEGLRLVASLRTQEDRIQIKDEDGTQVAENKGSQATYKVGVNGILPGGFRVYFSHGSAYNTPLLYQVLTNQFAGLAKLDNETSRTTQAGLQWERRGWSARLQASRTIYDHVVTYDWASGGYLNANDLRIQSLEGAFGRRTSSWGVEVTARSQEARRTDLPESQQFLGGGAAGRPFAQFGLQAFLKVGTLRLDGRWARSGGGYFWFDDKSGLDANKTHFNDVALSAALELGSAWTLTLRGEHLLQPRTTREGWLAAEHLGRNDAYTIPDFPAQGPTAALELRYRF